MSACVTTPDSTHIPVEDVSKISRNSLEVDPTSPPPPPNPSGLAAVRHQLAQLTTALSIRDNAILALKHEITTIRDEAQHNYALAIKQEDDLRQVRNALAVSERKLQDCAADLSTTTQNLTEKSEEARFDKERLRVAMHETEGVRLKQQFAEERAQLLADQVEELRKHVADTENRLHAAHCSEEELRRQNSLLETRQDEVLRELEQVNQRYNELEVSVSRRINFARSEAEAAVVEATTKTQRELSQSYEAAQRSGREVERRLAEVKGALEKEQNDRNVVVIERDQLRALAEERRLENERLVLQISELRRSAAERQAAAENETSSLLAKLQAATRPTEGSLVSTEEFIFIRKENEKQRAQIALLETQLQSLRTQHRNELATEKHSARQEVEAVTARLDRAVEECRTTNGARARSETLVEQLNIQVAELTQQLHAANVRTKHLESDLETERRQVELFRRDVDDLTRQLRRAEGFFSDSQNTSLLKSLAVAQPNPQPYTLAPNSLNNTAFDSPVPVTSDTTTVPLLREIKGLLESKIVPESVASENHIEGPPKQLPAPAPATVKAEGQKVKGTTLQGVRSESTSSSCSSTPRTPTARKRSLHRRRHRPDFSKYDFMLEELQRLRENFDEERQQSNQRITSLISVLNRSADSVTRLRNENEGLARELIYGREPNERSSEAEQAGIFKNKNNDKDYLLTEAGELPSGIEKSPDGCSAYSSLACDRVGTPRGEEKRVPIAELSNVNQSRHRGSSGVASDFKSESHTVNISGAAEPAERELYRAAHVRSHGRRGGAPRYMEPTCNSAIRSVYGQLDYDLQQVCRRMADMQAHFASGSPSRVFSKENSEIRSQDHENALMSSHIE